ncbi:globin domain-containing protein [Streptomyces sp. MAR4 CNX-425]|uniref:globin domain-containing protein n=1 Tax=Streptomyces sp. MAR4 CNX-425 TaxID=3406343 RepID=UPI003B50E2D6
MCVDANERIRASFARVERRADHVAKYFYSHLFARNPGVRDLFPADMSEQRDRLFAALTLVVQRLDDPDLPRYLTTLGRDHRKFDARPEHYAAVGESLIAALRFGLPNTWDEETEQAWLGAYKILSDAMISGSEEADRQQAPRWWDCRVVSRHQAAPGVTVLTLLPDRPLPYAAGQFVSVSAPQVPRVWRPYSIGCAPRADRTVDLHVSRVEGGLLSPLLVEGIRPDDTLRLGAPAGTAVLPERAGQPVTFIAAGTGWAPVRALLEDMVRRWKPTTARLFLVARSTAHLYDPEAVEALRKHHPWVDVTVVTPERGERQGATARRLEAALATCTDWARHRVYLSGPAHFITDLREVLRRYGTPPEQIAYDHVPAPERQGREPGHSSWFLQPSQPQWINPANR